MNENLVELPFSTRLLFIGLWTLADREGRLADKPKQIRLAIFPADDVDVDKGLTELADAGFIERYEAKGEKYIQTLNFTKHQSPHIKEAASTIPAPVKHRASTRRAALIPDSPFLIPESTSLNPLTDSDASEPTLTETILDGLRERQGVTCLPHEPLWLDTIQWAELNDIPAETFLECYDHLTQQNWRDGPVKPAHVQENLTNMKKLRAEIERQKNGTNKQPSEREKSAQRNIEQEQLANDIRAGKYDEAVERLFSRDGNDHSEKRVLRELPGAN